VSYRDQDTWDVVYAVLRDGEWQTQVIFPSPDDIVHPTAIAVGEDGSVHIAFGQHQKALEGGEDVDTVRYIRLDGGPPLEVVIDPDQTTNFIDIFVLQGVATIAYKPFNAANGGVRLVEVNGEPPYDFVPVHNEGGEYVQFSDDGTALVHHSDFGGEVYLSRHTGQVWETTVVCGDCNAAGAAVTVDDAGLAAVAWYDAGDFDGGEALRFASEQDSWEAIDLDRSATWSEDLWMGLDSSGAPWICYGHEEVFGQGDVRLATRESGTWKLRQIGNTGEASLYCHGDVAPDGSLHVLHHSSSGFLGSGFTGLAVSTPP